MANYGLLLTNYDFFIHEWGQWVQWIVFALFIYSQWERWNQLKHISIGFLIIGQVMLICLLVGLALMMFGNMYLIALRVTIYLALFAWNKFNTWYLSRMDIRLEDLQQVQPAHLPDKPIFRPLQRLLNYLQRNPDELPFWVNQNLRTALLWLAVVGITYYGFTRAINGYGQGFKDGVKIAAQQQQKTEKKLEQTVVSAVSSATATLHQELDSVKLNQGGIFNMVVNSNKERKQENKEVKTALAKANKKAKVQESRFKLEITPKKQTVPGGSFGWPDVQDLPRIKYDKKGRKISLADSLKQQVPEAPDSSWYAKSHD